MAEPTMPRTRFAPGRLWGRISPSIIPILAVVSALLLTVPFMIITGGRGDIARGLQIAGTAYSALLEGSLGLVVNDIVSSDDFGQLNALAAAGEPLERGDLRRLSRSLTDLIDITAARARAFEGVFAALPDLSDEEVDTLATSLSDVRLIGADALDTMRPLVENLAALDRGDVRDLADAVMREDALTAETRAAIDAAVPGALGYDDAALYAIFAQVSDLGIARLTRAVENVGALAQANIALDSPEADGLVAIGDLPDGAAEAREVAAMLARLDRAGVSDAAALQEQIEIVRRLYDENLLTGDNVLSEINDNLTRLTADNLIVRRPGNRVIVARGSSVAGLTYAITPDTSGSPDTSSATGEAAAPADTARPDVAYLRLGGSVLLFFPANLETMLVRAIPFIIAGLAVALGFKAGVFNIGAEGQMYAGAILAVWIGFSPIFAGLPWFVHVPLTLIAGLIGGGLWGAIPGALKAFTGASEVIVTIMLNYIAIRFVDWLIKSTDPVILLDPTASTPRTPFVAASAQLPRFDTIPAWLFIAAGAAFAAFAIYRQRERIARDTRALIRPLASGLLIAVGGLFLSWITVRGALHIGLIIMLGAVWFTDWFLVKTTLGFEIRTVGANPNAARYGGMSVARNIILAMMMSGALAGLAGAIEIGGVQLNMQPEFFAGVGFDAIAVALLARSNPRSMIASGLLWGSLLAGAGLMQLRANISIDLVKIIQALIIMFIAADAIVRAVWRVPATPVPRGGTPPAAGTSTTQAVPSLLTSAGVPVTAGTNAANTAAVLANPSPVTPPEHS